MRNGVQWESMLTTGPHAGSQHRAVACADIPSTPAACAMRGVAARIIMGLVHFGLRHFSDR